MAKKILIVEDDQDIVELLRYNLEKEGYKCYSANNGAAGLEIAIKKEPDLIILDIMMPGDDGLTLTKEIRDNSDIPIILLTAKSGTESKIEGLEVGADDYLTKPFNPKELLLRVLSILKR